MKNELAEAEVQLASALHNYFRQLSVLRDAELVERLTRRFKDPATVAAMRRAILNGE